MLTVLFSSQWTSNNHCSMDIWTIFFIYNEISCNYLYLISWLCSESDRIVPRKKTLSRILQYLLAIFQSVPENFIKVPSVMKLYLNQFFSNRNASRMRSFNYVKVLQKFILKHSGSKTRFINLLQRILYLLLHKHIKWQNIFVPVVGQCTEQKSCKNITKHF